MVAWNAVALQFWAAYLAQRRHYAALLPSLTGSTGPMQAAAGRNLSYFASSCPEPARFTLALYSLSAAFTKLVSFSPEAPRPTAANVDQGASVKKPFVRSVQFRLQPQPRNTALSS